MSLFIYLIRRDRKEIKIITTLKGGNCVPRRLNDLKPLKLPKAVHDAIEKNMEANKMLWEVWIESANSVQDLSVSVKNRGIQGFPLKPQPLVILSEIENAHHLTWNRQADPMAVHRLNKLGK